MKYIPFFFMIILLSSCSKIVIVPFSPEKDITFKEFIEIADRYSVILEKEKIKFSVLKVHDNIFMSVGRIGTETRKREMGENEGPMIMFNSDEENTFSIKYPVMDIDFVSRKKGDINFREPIPDRPEGESKIGIYKHDTLIEKLSENESKDIGIEVFTKIKNSQQNYYYRIPLTKERTVPYAINADAEKFTVDITMNGHFSDGPEGMKDMEGGMDRRPPGGDQSFGDSGMPSGPPPGQGTGMGMPGGGRGRPASAQNDNTIKLTVKLKNKS